MYFYSKKHQVNEAKCLANVIHDFKAEHLRDLASIFIGISFNVSKAQGSLSIQSVDHNGHLRMSPHHTQLCLGQSKGDTGVILQSVD